MEKMELTSKRTLRNTDWLEDRIFLFIGNPYVGKTTCTVSAGPETYVVLYEKDVPQQATINQIFKYVKRSARNAADRRIVYRRLKNLLDRGEIDRVGRGVYQLTKKGEKQWLILNDMNEANIALKREGDICFHFDPRLNSLAVHAITFDPTLIEPIREYFRQKMKKKGRFPESLYFTGELGSIELLAPLIFSFIDKFFKLENMKITRDTLTKFAELVGSDQVLSQLFKNQPNT
jgi:hypothetical protein